jgi:Amino acid permease
MFLAYEGFELIANASEDARDPERSLPRAYLIAIGSVICLYVLVVRRPRQPLAGSWEPRSLVRRSCAGAVRRAGERDPPLQADREKR